MATHTHKYKCDTPFKRELNYNCQQNCPQHNQRSPILYHHHRVYNYFVALATNPSTTFIDIPITAIIQLWELQIFSRGDTALALLSKTQREKYSNDNKSVHFIFILY